MACGLSIEGRRYSGFVLDISLTGLYVQTSARPSPGTMLDVELALPTQEQPVCMKARVARQKLVPPELLSVAQGGIGLHLQDPPAIFTEYYRSVTPPEQRSEGPGGSGAVPKAAARRVSREPDAASLRYRVRVSQISGSRSRTLIVGCDTTEEAQRKALAEVGEGWKILSIDPA